MISDSISARVRATGSAIGHASAVVLAAIIAASGAAAQDFSAGLSAFNSHRYDVAFAQWWPLAAKGHTDSQAALGYMYLKGLGVAQDDAAAARLYANAAARGQVDAQYFLGLLYLQGRGVPRDYAQAHVLCELAMTRGVPRALRCRDEAMGHLNAEQLDRNYRRVAEWYEKFEPQ